MTPQELSQALRIRRLREERAERALAAARNTRDQAAGVVSQAKGKLVAFDHKLESSLRAFEERTSKGVNPAAIEQMKGFHADQLKLREDYVGAIANAQVELARTQAQMDETRAHWQRAFNAAENLQGLSDKSELDAKREDDRRAESEIDEIFGSLANRRLGG